LGSTEINISNCAAITDASIHALLGFVAFSLLPFGRRPVFKRADLGGSVPRDRGELLRCIRYVRLAFVPSLLRLDAQTTRDSNDVEEN
jgi:hypothetical protein